jgi:hypothetical protein
MPSRAGDTAARGECRNSVTHRPVTRLTVPRPRAQRPLAFRAAQDVPLTELHFRCLQCGTDRTDFGVTSRDNTRSRGERRETESWGRVGSPSPAGAALGVPPR